MELQPNVVLGSVKQMYLGNNDLQGFHKYFGYIDFLELHNGQPTSSKMTPCEAADNNQSGQFVNQLPISSVTDEAAQTSDSNGRPSLGFIDDRAAWEVQGHPFTNNEWSYFSESYQQGKDILQSAISAIDCGTDPLTLESSENVPVSNLSTIDLSLFPDPPLQVEGAHDERVSQGTLYDTRLQDPVVQQSSSSPSTVNSPPSSEISATGPTGPRKVKKSKTWLNQLKDAGVHKPTPQRKIRLWEIEEVFEDKEMEKKRQDAHRAKRNRLRSKTGKQTLEQQLQSSNRERDQLKKEVALWKSRFEGLVKSGYSSVGQTSDNHGQVMIL